MTVTLDRQQARIHTTSDWSSVWSSTDQLGFDANDTNLQRYVGNSPTLFTDPDGLKKFHPLDAVTANDVKIAEEIVKIEEDMLKSGWTPTDLTDTGAYGKEVSRRLNEVLAKNGGKSCRGTFKTGVLVDNKSGEIVGFGATKGTAEATEIDVVFFPEGRKPERGMKVDPAKDIAYEVKTSAGGAMSAEQQGKYSKLFGEKFRKVTSKYRLARPPGSARPVMVGNADYAERMKWLAVVGLGLSVYAMLTTDAQGAEYDSLCESISRMRNSADEQPHYKYLARREVIERFKQYLDAVSGGYTADQTGILQWVMGQKAMEDFGNNR